MGVELFHADRQTDEHSDMTKRIVYFLNYLTNVIYHCKNLKYHNASCYFTCLLKTLLIPEIILNEKLKHPYLYKPKKRWRSWLRHYAISRKATGSILDDDIEIFL